MAQSPTAYGPLLLRRAHVYAPDDLGLRDVLISGGKVIAVEPEILPGDLPPGWPAVEVHDLSGELLVPGLVDAHEHLTGGGGEGGPQTRTPEVSLTMLTQAGVTTVVGCLGTDGVTRSMAALLAKASALAAEGLTTYVWTGAYEVPTPTITGSVRSDIILIDRVVGCGEIAVSDHRSAQPTPTQLRQLAAECRVGGMLGGKPGLLHLHVGSGPRGIQDVFDIIADGEIPASQFLPTHMGRTPALIEQAAKLTRLGGMADFTAGASCSAAVAAALAHKADPARLTISSDGGGSLPRFDDRGSLVGLQVGSPSTLLTTVASLHREHGLSLDLALRMATANPAAALGLAGGKGKIAPGADADLLVLDTRLSPKHLWAGGRMMLREGRPVVYGTFEVPGA